MSGGTILADLAALATSAVESAGYPGVFVLMAMESMFFPVPSEAVMPPAGILVAEGRFSFWLVVLASTLGSLVGSLASYEIGRRGAAPFVRRWGKWFLLSPHHLDQAHAFFEKRGVAAVFLARFIPGVRHVSSIPAGAAKMPLLPFCVATVVGASAWNLTLLYAGITLGRNWERVLPYFALVQWIAVGIAIVAAAWFVIRWRRNRAAVS